jgi:hypothetical protein
MSGSKHEDAVEHARAAALAAVVNVPEVEVEPYARNFEHFYVALTTHLTHETY